MASSKVMASSSSANSDLTRQSSLYSLTVSELQNDQSKNFGSMNMDEIFKTIYGDNPAAPAAEIIPNAATCPGRGDGELNGGIANVNNKSAEEVWKDFVTVSGGGGVDRKLRDVGDGPYFKEPAYEITLEDFLAKAGAVREEDVRVTQVAGPAQGVFPVDPMLSNRFQQPQPQQQQQPQIDGSVAVFGNGMERTGLGRGKRRMVEEPVDKVTQQRQRRMIKNRESAARSREKKKNRSKELSRTSGVELTTTIFEDGEHRRVFTHGSCLLSSSLHIPASLPKAGTHECRRW